MPINWKCAPADGTNAANDEDSARPLAARITGYLSRASVWRGVQWPLVADCVAKVFWAFRREIL